MLSQSNPITAGRLTEREQGGFPTPPVFRTLAGAARIFKACELLPWQQTCVTLGFSPQPHLRNRSIRTSKGLLGRFNGITN